MFYHSFFRGIQLFWATLWVCKSFRTLHWLRPWKLGRHWSWEDKCSISFRYCILSCQLHTLLYMDWMLLTNQLFHRKSCIIIKIIEYVQESFCSFCKQETTGQILELKFLGLKCTLKVWYGYLYILLRKIVNESLITEGFLEFQLYLFTCQSFPSLYPFIKLSHIKIFGLFRHHEYYQKLFQAHAFETFHMKVKAKFPH